MDVWSWKGRALLAACLMLLGLTPARNASAAIYGVPTNLNADGTRSAASVDPPGYFGLDGIANGFNNGEGVHQLKLFIEVTGGTLDILVFDPGSSASLDIGGNATTTTYRLLLGATTIATAAIGNEANLSGGDAGTTDNRLVRFAPPCGAPPTSCGWFRPDSASANNVSFSGLAPGLYELRITTSVANSSESNLFGVRVAVSKGAGGQPAGSYNAYTTANSDTNTGAAGATETAFLGGPSDSGTPSAGTITEPLAFFPFVNRGCSLQTSNFDMDLNVGGTGLGSTGSITDVLGVTSGLTMSNNTAHAENTITIENAGATNLESINYGMYLLTNDTGSQNNAVDWRVADFQGTTSNGANFPLNPVNPIRAYLPQAYAPVDGNPNASAPAEPTLTASARVASGANPPLGGSTTRFVLTATVDNCAVRNATSPPSCASASPAASTSVDITIPLAPNTTADATGAACTLAGIGGLCQECKVNGVATACAVTNNGGSFTARFANLAATDAASFDMQVSYSPPLATVGVQNLTGPPAAGAPPPNTTVWAQYASGFGTTETLGPVCNLTVAVGPGAALLTRATLRGLRVDPSGYVEFATSSQHGSAAFNLYATRDPQGRGPRRLLNSAPVPSHVPTSLAPSVYRVPTQPMDEPYLLIEEIDTRGRHRFLGPFATAGDDALQAAFGASETRSLTASSPPRRMHSGARVFAHEAGARSRAHGVKIEVSQAGPVRVTLAELRQAGLPVMPHARLRLSNQGRRVPFEVSDGELRFTAEALSTDYTGRNVYVLTWSEGTARLRTRLTRSAPLPPRGFSRIEQSTIYLANAPEGSDPWLWDLLFGDGSSWPYVDEPGIGSFDLPGLPEGLAGPVPLQVRFLGRSSHRHSVSVAINGAAAGTLTFTGAKIAVLLGSVPGEALLPAGNQLSITYTTSGGDPSELGLAYLDSLDLGVSLEPVSPVTVERIAPFAAPAALGDAEYLILTHADFREAADRLAALKRAAGFRTAVLDVERAYDGYSAGIVEAGALRALLRDAARAGLKYVLLLGGDTFDTHDYLGTGAVPFVPSLLAFDGEFGRIPSENLYADLDGDGKPELAIGRLPARTPEEANTLVDKIDAGSRLDAAGGTHVFAVDNQGPGDPDFETEADGVAAGLPPTTARVFARVQEGVATARSGLFSALALGATAVHYFGHAGTEQWADEDLLTVDDTASLAGTPPTIVFTWACEGQFFQNVFGPSLGEALVLVPNGGARASFGPAGITDPQRQRSLYTRLYQDWIASGLPLGEAIRRAKADAVAADPASRPVVDGWNLLGDPALGAQPSALRRPASVGESATWNEHVSPTSRPRSER